LSIFLNQSLDGTEELPVEENINIDEFYQDEENYGLIKMWCMGDCNALWKICYNYLDKLIITIDDSLKITNILYIDTIKYVCGDSFDILVNTTNETETSNNGNEYKIITKLNTNKLQCC